MRIEWEIGEQQVDFVLCHIPLARRNCTAYRRRLGIALALPNLMRRFGANATGVRVTAMGISMKVAVATKEGKAISEHFGHAKRFAVYAVTPESVCLLEDREVEHYCLGGEGNASAMPGILAAVQDCAAVFVAKIGDGPTEKLCAIGVVAVSDYAWEPIEASLLDYARRLEAEDA
jgi:predicted Fe-Mo cluster-binding NifX family protein